ncbi:PREDICTED: DCN1-like protein 3 [Nicrophorus vespilloides]|uniref:Defective in cullin neddylation protein n=1 Tax=Nicrophorus vespilloides TaxID=110193 RepID=A0ABM1N760_NICVS|nr:PREDICTED: DCN1-like protein 3 [Nicrophorus vespilloides]
MGNCLTCFKEPSPTALENDTPPATKEEMPEAHPYTATVVQLNPTVAEVSLAEQSLLSNGNHLSSSQLSDSAPAAAIRFYQRRGQSKSAPMGLSDSKPSDVKLNALFDVYKDEDDCILADGIEQLCKDLQVSPDEFKVLLLAWKLEAAQMCRFTREEFVTGMKKLRADSIKSLQARLPEVVVEVERNDESFKNLYRFTFKFGLDSAEGQRILPMDVAMILWRLVFTVREPPILDRWLNFLKKHEQYRGIPKDTWNMFLNFSDTVGDDLSSYDDNEAWPSLFDDFVEFENDQANQNVTKDKDCEGLIITKDDCLCE